MHGHVGLDAAGDLHHRAGGVLDGLVMTCSNCCENGGAERGCIRDFCQGERYAGDIGMNLHPEIRARRAAADAEFVGDIAVRAHRLENRLRAERHAFDNGAEDVSATMLQAQSRNRTAREGIGVGRAIALEMFLHDQAVSAGREGRGLSIECLVGHRIPQHILEPVDHRAGGGLAAFNRVKPGHHAVLIGAPNTLAVERLGR